MSIFQRWKQVYQKPSRPATSPEAEAVIRFAFYGGAQAALRELDEKWPTKEDADPVAAIAAVKVKMQREIEEYFERTGQALESLESQRPPKE